MFLYFEKIDFGSDDFGSDDDRLQIIFNEEKFKLSGPNVEGQLMHFDSKHKEGAILKVEFEPNGNSKVGNGYRIWLFSDYTMAPPSTGTFYA